MSVPLRPYQRACVDAVHDAARRGIRRPLCALATGLGKSLAAAYVVKERGPRAVVLAHRDELLRQLGRSMQMADETVRIGYVKAEEDDVHADVVIASLQTLARPARLQRLLESQRGIFGRPFATVISDESHHVTSGEDENTFGAVLRGLGAFDAAGPLVVGWTATPERTDGAKMADVWEEMVFSMGILDGIRQGFLCDLKARQVQLAADFSKLHVRAGEFRDEESAEMLLEANAPKHAAEAYLQHAKGRKALVFTPTVAVAQAMAQAFRAVGVTAEHAHGEMDPEARRALLARFKSGETMVVPNAQLLTEGFDEPSVSCVIMARPTRSRPFYTQMVGRGTRIYPGKTDCLILDLVGVAARMDLTTMATLFDVPPAAAEGGIVAAIEAKEKGEAIPDGLDAPQGRLVSVDVELFAGRAFAWVVSGLKFILSLGAEGNVTVEPGSEPDTFDVFKVKPGRAVKTGSRWGRTPTEKQKLYAGLSLEYATGAAEDVVRKAEATVLNARDAAWRQHPASEAQIKKLRSRYRPGMLKGEASDLLTAMYAGR